MLMKTGPLSWLATIVEPLLYTFFHLPIYNSVNLTMATFRMNQTTIFDSSLHLVRKGSPIIHIFLTLNFD
jgi:hypothetical protein